MGSEIRIYMEGGIGKNVGLITSGYNGSRESPFRLDSMASKKKYLYTCNIEGLEGKFEFFDLRRIFSFFPSDVHKHVPSMMDMQPDDFGSVMKYSHFEGDYDTLDIFVPLLEHLDGIKTKFYMTFRKPKSDERLYLACNPEIESGIYDENMFLKYMDNLKK